jgi:retron-type reverse transcriptase
VVQGALKLILEPIFEADFQEGSFGYRPKRREHTAVMRVAEAIAKYKTRAIDIDLRAYFDTVKHSVLLDKDDGHDSHNIRQNSNGILAKITRGCRAGFVIR